jgi:integrase
MEACMPALVALTRSSDAAGNVIARLGLPLTDEYLVFLAGRCRPDTVLAVAYDLKVFFTAAGKPPDAVTTADVLAFMTAQRTGGRGRLQRAGEYAGGVSARTLRRRLSSVSGLFAFLQARGDVVANPVPRGLPTRRERQRPRQGVPLVKVTRTLPVILSPAEVDALTAALRTHRDRAMVAAMVLGGLRRCEVLGLRLEDLRFGERRVHQHGPAALTDPHRHRIRLDEPVGAGIQRPGPELLYRAIEALGQLRHLALGQAGDAQGLRELLHPVLYPGVFPHLAALTAARADLVAILLTGIPAGIISGFQNFTGATLADMLRLNMAIPPAANPNIFGILGGDLAGFPNGRRVADDVVAIELRAIAGVTYPLVNSSFTPDAAASKVTDGTTPSDNPIPFLTAFPYLGVPANGFDTVPPSPS